MNGSQDPSSIVTPAVDDFKMKSDALNGVDDGGADGGDDALLDEIMLDVAAAEMAAHHQHHDQPQSLEDILRDTEYLDIDYLDSSDLGSGSAHNTPKKTPLNLAIPAGGIDADISDTLSIKSYDSKSGRKSSALSHRSSGSGGGGREYKSEFGSIMRHVILKAVSSQLTSAVERLHAGQPTCMTTTHLIAIGTQNGFVLVFDSSQVIKWFLGGAEVGHNYGAVSSLALSADSTRLLAGFARGQLMEFDLVTGRVVRDMGDTVHPPGSAVTMLCYSDDPNTAFLADSGGSVFEVNMKRGLRGPGATARCIFSGSRGEVCSMAPLRVAAYPGHPLSDFSILALATISKVITVTVKPKLKVLMTSPLTGDPETLPLICWQFVVIQNPSSSKVVDPVLTFARDTTIHFYQVTVNLSDKIVFIPVQCVTVSYKLLALHWLNTRLLGLVSTAEQFHLMDVRSGDQLETVDLTNVRMVYQTQFFKSLATGGNVSPAMSVAGEMAVYGSTTSFTNQLLVLGASSFHVLVIRSWTERLEQLLRGDKVAAAMMLGLEFHEDPARALVGLRGSRERKCGLISMRLVGILKKFLASAMTTKFPVEGGMGTLTKYFNEIVPPCVELCVKLGQTELLFEAVWSTFSQDPFSAAVYLECLEPYILSDQLPRLPTPIVQQFVAHYEARAKLEGLEACLTHIAVDCLDIHQALSICQQHNLFDAIIYIYNNAMLDYITPVEKLLKLLSNKRDYTDDLVRLGNKLLVYISQCLAGRAYPYGDIPGDRVKQAKYDVFSTITLLSARNSDTEEERSHPHLHTLLMFDTQGFLNVLSIAFEEAEFSGEVGQCQKQRLVDILLQVMLADTAPFSPHQVGYLASFLARLLARPDNTVLVSRAVFSQVLAILTQGAGQGAGQREERQQAVLDITDQGWHHFDPGRLEQECRAAGFYRVLERLYERSGRHDDILDCYLQDTSLRSRVFTWLARTRVSQPILMEKMDTLIELDTIKFCDIILKYSDEDNNLLRDVLERLTDRRPVLYEFLHHVLAAAHPTVTQDMHSRHLELMAEFQPGHVAQYLANTDNHELYSMEEAFKLCSDHDLVDAKVYLLERQGRLLEAFELLIAALKQSISETLAQLDSNSVEILNVKVMEIVALCQRSSSVLDQAAQEAMWCSLLAACVAPLPGLQDPALAASWRGLVRTTVTSMLGHVDNSRLVTIITQDPGYSATASWAEVKQVLGDILDTARYEQRLLEATLATIRAETADTSRLLVRARARGLAGVRASCSLCGQPLNTSASSGPAVRCVVFSSGHAYHVPCLERAGGVRVGPDKRKQWRCVRSCPGEAADQADGDTGAGAGTSIPTHDMERVRRAREFLSLYSREEEESDLSPGSIIKSDTFPLKLKPKYQ